MKFPTVFLLSLKKVPFTIIYTYAYCIYDIHTLYDVSYLYSIINLTISDNYIPDSFKLVMIIRSMIMSYYNGCFRNTVFPCGCE